MIALARQSFQSNAIGEKQVVQRAMKTAEKHADVKSICLI
jgi:hypothetical protein